MGYHAENLEAVTCRIDELKIAHVVTIFQIVKFYIRGFTYLPSLTEDKEQVLARRRNKDAIEQLCVPRFLRPECGGVCSFRACFPSP